ncbi:hypothetical protein FA13DRAFT_1408764 [Coprinellus micaceus]|uniref:Uncharacterized protein n=1 Tax=Coprinellus micaceus TaxID=71717 RepID=A0A4Y7SNL9_COPMI|nr:hypothetical protein FA13DRAFT_1408764 [Coprinellus micaceus]
MANTSHPRTLIPEVRSANLLREAHVLRPKDPMDSLDHSCPDRITFILSLIHDVDPIHSCQFLRTASDEGIDPQTVRQIYSPVRLTPLSGLLRGCS